MSSRRRSGLTLIELVIALTLITIVIVKLAIVMNEAQKVHRNESTSMALEDNARRVLDRISYALMGADRETLFPNNQFPNHHSSINYQISLGVEDGEVVWGDPEMIGLTADETQVFWAENPGEPNERQVVWCSRVRALLEEELANGLDDNMNGLADEKGLVFALDGNSLTIRLTLEQVPKEGKPVTKTVETTVSCRN